MTRLTLKKLSWCGALTLTLTLTLTLVVVPLAYAHEDHSPDASQPKAEGHQPTELPQAIILPALEGPTPWSDKPHLNHPDRFHIGIMTDRTGGHRPGIWMKAVKRINLLRPEFVVSVGDLIQGYTPDPVLVENQWQEFLGFIDQMDMKFFFVAGNHDVTNPMMHDIWREHFGPEWYSFDYKRVHFVCLSSEDPSSHIGEKQLAWIEQDLDEHQDARWTLVFLHKPLWNYAERAIAAGNPDPTNWKKVEKMLGARSHTVFSGHVHHYVQYDRNGMKYYHLATTGGGSKLRGVPYGEFDHVTWLTMEPDGPHVANLLLDGILPADAVTEKGIARFRKFLARSVVEIAPILIRETDRFSQGKIHMRLANHFDTKIEVSGEIDGLPLRGLTLDPDKLSLAAEPGQTAELALDLHFTEKIPFDHLAQTIFTARLSTVGEYPPLTAELTIPVIIDRRYDCTRSTQTVLVDGKLDEEDKLSEATGDHPLLLGNRAGWSGPDDASLEFGLTHDEKFVYFRARVLDDSIQKGDRLELQLDARDISIRRQDSQLRDAAYTFLITAPNDEGQSKLNVAGYRKAKLWPGTLSAAKRTGQGYNVELAIPINYLASNQSSPWHSFQFTVVIHDQDQDKTSQKPTQVVWRGTEEVKKRNTNYGQFVRTE